jgi:peptidoglycan-N-acetylglucosamine deacetylase
MILRLLIAAIITVAGVSGFPTEHIDPETVDLSSLQRPVDDGPPDKVYFAETGQYVDGEILEFWLQYGGVGVFGYPVSRVIEKDDHRVQYFQRSVLELYPDNPDEWRIQVRRLGDLAAGPSKYRSSVFDPPANPAGSEFEETGHSVGKSFQQYWEQHGVRIFGYPISQEFEANGSQFQYFERAILEYDPEKPRRWRFVLPLLGVEAAQADGVDTSPQQLDNSIAVYNDSLFGQGGAGPDDKVVYLTFDDGPNPTFTPQVLDLLYEYDAYATFFVLGSSTTAYPELVQRMIHDGHTVANHTWDHPVLAGVSFAELEWQLRKTAEVIGPEIAPCMRPPYGAMDSNTKPWSEALGYEVILWDVDPRDWERPGAEVIANHIISSVFPGANVLLHDGGIDRSQSVAALEIVLEELSRQGYRFEAICR